MQREPDRPRVLFLEEGGISTGDFLTPILDRLGNEFTIDHRVLRGHFSEEDLATLRLADLVWLEWGHAMTAALTRHVKELAHKPVICRIHGFEVYTPTVQKIAWSVIDHLVFVAQHKHDYLVEIHEPATTVPYTVIRNGIDLDKFAIAPGKANTKQLAFVGTVSYRKGFTTLLHFLLELLRRDPAFTLHVRSDFTDARILAFSTNLVKEANLDAHVFFYPDRIADLNAWFVDKSHILSFSIEESFHYALGEGMAAGLKPVIRAWPESRDIWPSEYIFTDVSGFLDNVLGSYTPQAYREELRTRNLTLEHQVAQIAATIRRTIVSHAPPAVLTHTPPTPPQPCLAPPQIADKTHIFIFGLKRSGTTILWESFRKDTQLRCYDEPFAEMLWHNVLTRTNNHKRTLDEFLGHEDTVRDYWSPILPHDEPFQELTKPQLFYLQMLLGRGQNTCIDFVRCNAKLATIREAIPDALYLHLIRDPRAFVTSHLKPYGRWLHPSLETADGFFTYKGAFNYWMYTDLSRALGHTNNEPAVRRLLRIWRYFNEVAQAMNPDITLQFEAFASSPVSTIRAIYNRTSITPPDIEYGEVHAPNPPVYLADPRWGTELDCVIGPTKFLYEFA